MIIEQKISAFEWIDDNGESIKVICDELNLGKSTVNAWRKKLNTLQDFCTQIESNRTLLTRCTLLRATNFVLILGKRGKLSHSESIGTYIKR